MDFGGLQVDFGSITGDYKVNDFLNNAFNELGLGFLQDLWLSNKLYVEKLIEKVGINAIFSYAISGFPCFQEVNNAVNGLSVFDVVDIIAHIKSNGLNEKVFQYIDPDCYNQTTNTFPLANTNDKINQE